MKNHIVKTLIFIFTLLSYNAFSQTTSKKLHITPMVGVNTPILGAGYGISTAISTAYDVHQLLSVEAQVSYFQTKVTSKFLSGGQETVKGNEITGGIRVNITPQDKPFSVYTNLLTGIGLSKTYEDSVEVYSTRAMPIQMGLFSRYKRIAAGISFSNMSNLNFYAGYIF